jgi:hypothetical protein
MSAAGEAVNLTSREAPSAALPAFSSPSSTSLPDKARRSEASREGRLIAPLKIRKMTYLIENTGTAHSLIAALPGNPERRQEGCSALDV